MRYQKLKEKFKHKYIMSVMAGVLCVILAGSSIGPAKLQAGEHTVTAPEAEKGNKSASDEIPQQKKAESKKDESIVNKIISVFDNKNKTSESPNAKEETVYLITDANGGISQTIVSGWLKNGSAGEEIKDISCLSDIENVKGDETFTKNGDKITWQAGGRDIYYKGTTTKKPPVTETLTYYLDGKEIAPEQLAGKSGQVTIRFDYTNHEKKLAEINGKDEEIYVPFTVMSGMILDDSFRNVRVNNGKILSDGNKIIVAGLAMPGLKESLGAKDTDFDSDFEFPEYVEVTADVENFSLEMTVTLAITGLLSDAEIASRFDLSELDDTIGEMTDAMGQLKDGGSQLSDGINTLDDSMKEFSSGAGTLKDGIDAYTEGVSGLASGIQTLSDGSGALEQGVNTLNSSAGTLNNGIQKLDQSLRTPMTEKEKAAARKEVARTVETQFQEGSETYQMIYDTAAENFNNTLTSEASVKTVQAGIQTGMQAQGLTSEGVVAALAEYYGTNGFTDGSGQTYPPEVCQSPMPGTDVTYGVYFASALLNGGLSSVLASGITSGIASQGAAAVGESVTGACREAAKQAGEAAAISGVESAKKQVVSAIETKDPATGHSLVSGMQALSQGTQQLADSVPALKNGIAQLLEGSVELTGHSETLKDGVSRLNGGALRLGEGAQKLKDGARELSDGLEEFDEKAVSRVADAYHGDIKDFTERVKVILQAGEDYRTFCGASAEQDASTKFIFRSGSIKTEDD